MKMNFKNDRSAVEEMITTEWSDEDRSITGFQSLEDLEGSDLYLVEVPKSKIIGCCVITAHENDSAQLSVYLKKEFRGLGLGREMITGLHDLVKILGATYVWSLVKEENKIMHKLLDSFGHETIPAMEPGYVVRGMEI